MSIDVHMPNPSKEDIDRIEAMFSRTIAQLRATRAPVTVRIHDHTREIRWDDISTAVDFEYLGRTIIIDVGYHNHKQF
jgi:hypothetical protein